MYGLLHPLEYLQNCPPKLVLKRNINEAVKSYWHQKFKEESQNYKSLSFFQVDFLPFGKCHPIYRTCGSSPYEVNKACIQGKLISGRYRLEVLTKYFKPENTEFCILPSCSSPETKHVGDIEAFFISCASLAPARLQYESYMSSYLYSLPHLTELVEDCLQSNPVQFFLDCSTMPPVIAAKQVYGESILAELFKMTRHFCFLLHRLRTKLISDCNVK